MTTQPKNLLALLIGSGQFSFADGTTTAALAQAAGYVDFGNVTVFSLANKGTTQEHIGSDNGVRKLDLTNVTEVRVGYQIKCDEISAANIKYQLYGTPGTKTTQTAKAAVACDALTTPVLGVWYDLLIAAVQYKLLSLVTIVSTPTVTENVDYVIDYTVGRIRFITAPPATLTSITITCPAITSGGVGSMLTIVPGNKPIRRGMGRLVCYDSDGTIGFVHDGFYCEIYPEAGSNFDGQKNTDLIYNINILSPVGVFQVAF